MDKADPRDDQAGAFRLLAEPSEEPIAAQEPALSLQERMHLFLVENLHHGLTLKDLSEFLGYSEKYCSEWFVARMGQSFSSYVKRLRVERATRLLGSSGRLADIAETLGFQDQYAFSHFFKKVTGLSPQAFRQRTSRALPSRSRPGRAHQHAIHRTCSRRREVRT